MTTERLIRDVYETLGITPRADEIRLCVPLSSHASFRIGGPADAFLTPDRPDIFSGVYRAAKEANIPVLILGRGTNILFADEGYRGVVLSTAAMQAVTVSGETVTAGAGATVNQCATAAWHASLDGMTFMYGIPGSIGGAVYMNAGAYGGECADVLQESTYLDLRTGEIIPLSKESHDFSYRHSTYMSGGRVVLSATFALRRGDADEIKAKMDDIFTRRVTKQPLDFPSAGSVFKRPEGYFAGKLIEDSGLKGYSVGGAQVSEKHAGFIINRGGATAADVLLLIDHIQTTVYQRFGVLLETEIIRMGADG